MSAARDYAMSLSPKDRDRFARRWREGASYKALESDFGLTSDQVSYWRPHQLRVRLPGDETVYRVIIAPADAPIIIGSVPADDHFLEPLQ